eukprot:TRINITY_DN9391_c0_g2_i1.p1 TRINITY_DN9391_c0_g2~~TRINITY_DN9391_c0_g2_i1.p1  ORF type:complete len:329 (-),score=98.04 TRINITY_DN9391_c0_g2_i1:434-1420(-)
MCTLDLSSQSFKDANKNRSEEDEQTQSLTHYDLAHNSFIQNFFISAVSATNTFLEKTTQEKFNAYGGYKLGLCYCMISRESVNQRDRKEALDKSEKIYQKIEGWTRKTMAYDTYANRKAKQFLARGKTFTRFDELYIQALNLQEASKFAQSLEILNGILDEFQPPSLEKYSNMAPQSKSFFGFMSASSNVPRVEQPQGDVVSDGKKEMSADEAGLFFYLHGDVLKELKQLQTATESLQKAIIYAPGVIEETWAAPYACLALAEIHIALHESQQALSSVVVGDSCPASDNIARANAYIQQTKTFTGYDFEKMINMKTKTVVAKIAALSK